MSVGIALTGICTDFALGACWAYAFSASGTVLALARGGVVLFGAVAAFRARRRPSLRRPSVFCVVCGRRTRRLGGSGEWYCPQCRHRYPSLEEFAFAMRKDAG